MGVEGMKAASWIKNRLPTRRRLIQVYAALLYNAHLKGYISGEIYAGSTKALCVPGLNCYSCPGALGACPLGALQNALASSGTRAPLYMLGVLLLLGLTLGRTICGFLCPMGLIQEILHKIPTPKLHKSRATRALSLLKYVILAVFVALIPLWYAAQRYPVPAFCKYICPAGTFQGAIGLLANPANASRFSMLNFLFTWKFVIMVLIFGASVFVYRVFCRFLCPLGAIYGLFARLNLVGVKVDASKCTHCGLCVDRCKMDVRHVGGRECIHCAGCVDACPAAAISFRAGGVTLWAPRQGDSPGRLGRNRCIAWCAALAVLAAALAYYNLPTGESPAPDAADTPVEAAPPEAPVGNEVGDLGPDFTVPLYGGGDFTLSDTRGTVTVINFWATWCGPCVAELPYFDQLFRDYGGSVAVVAVHSSLVTEDVDAYLANYGYAIPFALDSCGVLAAYGGSTMLPQTVILDQDGVIVYNAVGSVTYEQLESLVGALTEGA